MSAIGTKRTYVGALHMSAFGGKADMPSSDVAKVKKVKACSRYRGTPVEQKSLSMCQACDMDKPIRDDTR